MRFRTHKKCSFKANGCGSLCGKSLCPVVKLRYGSTIPVVRTVGTCAKVCRCCGIPGSLAEVGELTSQMCPPPVTAIRRLRLRVLRGELTPESPSYSMPVGALLPRRWNSWPSARASRPSLCVRR